MKTVLIVSFITLAPQLAVGQSLLDCDSLHSFFESLNSDHVGLMYYDIPPEPVDGYNKFYEGIAKQTQQVPGIDARVYVQFIIDTLGSVQCAKVVKSSDKSLNQKAIELIYTAQFIPAKQQGQPLYSSMVLPIVFGSEPPRKGKKECRRGRKH